MPETSFNKAGMQRPPDCDYLKNLILDGRKTECGGVIILVLLSGWTCSCGDLPRSGEGYYFTGSFSLDFGNRSACSVLFPTIWGIFTPD